MTEHAGGIPSSVGEAFTRCSHAPTMDEARFHFEQAWRRVEPQLRTIAIGALRDKLGYADRYRADEAMSHAALKLWVHLRGENAMIEGGRTIQSGYVRTVIVNCCSDHATATREHAAENVPLITPDEDAGDPTAARPELAVHTDTETSPLLEQLAHRAVTEFRKPRWAAILREISRGHHRRADIADALGENQNTIRFDFMRMRQVGLFDELRTQGQRGERIADALEAVLEQLALFDATPVEPIAEGTRRHRPTVFTTKLEQIDLFEGELGAVSA